MKTLLLIIVLALASCHRSQHLLIPPSVVAPPVVPAPVIESATAAIQEEMACLS